MSDNYIPARNLKIRFPAVAVFRFDAEDRVSTYTLPLQPSLFQKTRIFLGFFFLSFLFFFFFFYQNCRPRQQSPFSPLPKNFKENNYDPSFCFNLFEIFKIKVLPINIIENYKNSNIQILGNSSFFILSYEMRLQEKTIRILIDKIFIYIIPN